MCVNLLLLTSLICCVLVCSHQQLEAHLPCTPAGSRRLQVYVWWETGDRVVSAQLLLPLWEHCLHHGLQGRQQTRAQAVSSRSRLWTCDTSSNNHPLLPLMIKRKFSLSSTLWTSHPSNIIQQKITCRKSYKTSWILFFALLSVQLKSTCWVSHQIHAVLPSFFVNSQHVLGS